MGYLISAHIVRDEPDVAILSGLPASIGRHVYRHRLAGVYLIDTFRASRPPGYPFQTPLPAIDIPLDLPPELNILEQVYRSLDKLKLANAFKKSYINFGLILNGLLGQPVMSFISDDDEWDFACTIADGSLSRMKCRCGDLVIIYQNDDTSIQPLVPEFGEDEEFLSNIEDLRALLPNIRVSDRDTPWDSQLHAIAVEEWRNFSGAEELILGLGSFDPPEDEADWELIDPS